MDQKFIISLNCRHIESDFLLNKALHYKSLFPMGKKIGFLDLKSNITLKFRNETGGLIIDDQTEIFLYKDIYCLKINKDSFDKVFKNFLKSNYVILIIEGSKENVRIILYFDDGSESIFDKLETENPAIRLTSYDLPPNNITVIDSKDKILNDIYSFISKNDKELFSVRATQFLKNPHILTHLFSHVMSLKSKDHINYISNLKVISDKLRELLKPKIKKIQRDHNSCWADFYGSRISFVDGGMSRIVSLPGTEPMGIRVGIYTVIPGETDLDKREEWNLYPYVIGDVVSDRSIINSTNYQTDTKRLQEASRYILEPLSALNYYYSSLNKPEILFLHGPLQNAFQMYDEIDPHYIPGVDKDFLKRNGISEKDINNEIKHIPTDSIGNTIWNGCIAVYAYIMKKISNLEIPFVGVIERSSSRAITIGILDLLVEEKVIPTSTKKAIMDKVKKYEIYDEFLFGCILEEGEYIDPIKLTKNRKTRAHDKWQPVVDSFPQVDSTILKCSANNFPFRVEMNILDNNEKVNKIMSLLYHTSLLLPNYAFPVGIDIADKFAKIPDWLSKGISARLTATILNKVMQTGNDRMLRQARQLLARSPRDFFFRPKV